MAANESEFRSEVKKAIEENGGFCKVISQKFLVGTVDMHVTYPPNYSAWIEFKFIPKMPKNGIITLELTILQRSFLSRESRSGGRSGWIVGIKVDKNIWFAYSGKDPLALEVSGSPTDIRKSGQKWNHEKLLAPIFY